MESKWKKFVSAYNTQKTFWKVHQRDLDDVEALVILSIIKSYEGLVWSQANQSRFRKELIKENVIKPRVNSDKESDANAIVRGIIRVLTIYGLCYWSEKEKKITLTPLGHDFLSKGDFQAMKETQVWKYIIYNPNFPKNYSKMCIVPHAALVEILLELGQLDYDEYILFVSRIETHDSIKDKIDQIKNWRHENNGNKEKIKSTLSSAKLSKRGGSIYDNIKRNTVYAIKFFADNISYIKIQNGIIKISQKEIALNHLENFKKNFEPIPFVSREDWMEFYGNLEKKFTKKEALEYVEEKTLSTGKREFKQQASKIYKLYPSLRRSKSIKSYEENIENEIFMHKFFKDNIDTYFPGYKVANINGKSGFKYKIPEFGVGEIDLLCKDKNNNFVIIEFKKRKGSDETVGQTLRYIGWVKKNLCKNNQKVNGIIVCREYKPKIKYAAEAIGGVLRYFETPFKIGLKERRFD